MDSLKIKNQQIFITPDREKEYFRKNKIHIKRLNNGINIIGITREISDSKNAGIDYIFPTGSYFDPKGKSGLHHLTEHLFNKSVKRMAYNLNVNVNASTGYYSLVNDCDGTVNPVVKQYGLWMVLPKIIKALSSPVGVLKDPRKTLETEKQVIKAEIVRRDSSHGEQVIRYWNEIVYGLENPITTDSLGTLEGLASIKIEDVQSLVDERLIPHDLLVTVFCEADEAITGTVVNKLETLLKDFPRGTKKNPKRDWMLLDKINPNLKSGEIYKKDIGLKNRMITLILSWNYDREPFTPLTFSINRYASAVSDELHLLSRKKGWSYYSNADAYSSGIYKGDFSLRIDIPKKDLKEIEKFSKEFLSEANKNVLEFSQQQIQKMLSKEKRRQEADPILVKSRLHWLVEGLTRWERFISVDETRKIFAQIKTKDIKYWQNKFINTPPAVIIVGDIS